jgi:hypothetical protein
MKSVGKSRSRVAASAIVLGAVLLAACGGGSNPAAGSASTSVPAVTSAAPPPLSASAILHRVSWQAGDLRAGYRADLMDGGNVVDGQVTLDECGYRFASEARRRFRYQTNVDDSHGEDAGVSIEAVIYDSPAGATQAMTELRRAQATCPKGYVASSVEDVPPLRYQFAAAPDASWPKVGGVERLTQLASVSDQRGEHDTELAVYQARGRVLVGLYLDDPASVRGLAHDTRMLTGEIARRLQELPAASVNATATA